MRILLLVAAGCSASPAQPHTLAKLSSPESVLLVGDRALVSNIGVNLDPLGKDGDGYISELDGTRVFTGLDAPKGMATLDGVLYVADVDRVVGFNIATHARVFEASVAEKALLNDLDVSDGALIVTDTLRDAVYRLDLGDKQFTPLATEIAGANGVAVGRDAIYVVGLGTALAGGDAPGDIVRIAGDGTKTALGVHGLFDGIAIDGDALLVSDWVAISPPTAGRILRIEGERVTELPLPEAMHGPADFAYDRAHHQLLIPRSLDQRVSRVRMTSSP